MVWCKTERSQYKSNKNERKQKELEQPAKKRRCLGKLCADKERYRLALPGTIYCKECGNYAGVHPGSGKTMKSGYGKKGRRK